MSSRERLKQSRTWVVKVGSTLLTDHDAGLNTSAIGNWVDQIVTLRKQGVNLVLVSSGSIAEGMQRLGWSERPHEVYRQQAAAAVGQMGLIQAYESAFQKHGLHTAQILLTHEDLADRQRYLNARSTLRTLLNLGVIPIVNENDTVITEEIRFGDNDTLASLVVNLIEAEVFVILTDQAGLYSDDPRKSNDSYLIKEAKAGDRSLEKMAGPGGEFGRGGMLSKLKAAEKAARSGATTIIVSGRESQVLTQLREGEPLGTVLVPAIERMTARKQWLAGNLRTQGKLVLDDGAVKVLRQSGRSLLPIGVKSVSGTFSRGEMVVCVDSNQLEVARGLVNYDAAEAQRIIGRPSDKIEEILGYVDEPELIHRDNMVIS